MHVSKKVGHGGSFSEKVAKSCQNFVDFFLFFVFQEWRKAAFEKGDGTTHWPNEANRSCRARKTYKPLKLSESQSRVV